MYLFKLENNEKKRNKKRNKKKIIKKSKLINN